MYRTSYLYMKKIISHIDSFSNVSLSPILLSLDSVSGQVIC